MNIKRDKYSLESNKNVVCGKSVEWTIFFMAEQTEMMERRASLACKLDRRNRANARPRGVIALMKSDGWAVARLVNFARSKFDQKHENIRARLKRVKMRLEKKKKKHHKQHFSHIQFFLFFIFYFFYFDSFFHYLLFPVEERTYSTRINSTIIIPGVEVKKIL